MMWEKNKQLQQNNSATVAAGPQSHKMRAFDQSKKSKKSLKKEAKKKAIEEGGHSGSNSQNEEESGFDDRLNDANLDPR